MSEVAIRLRNLFGPWGVTAKKSSHVVCQPRFSNVFFRNCKWIGSSYSVFFTFVLTNIELLFQNFVPKLQKGGSQLWEVDKKEGIILSISMPKISPKFISYQYLPIYLFNF